MSPVIIGNATLYLGDCREILPSLRADALITDPPYGIGVRLGTIGKGRNRNAYESFDDTKENVRDSIIPAIKTALLVTKRGMVTPGPRCLSMYPDFTDIGMIYQPACVGMTAWGRCTCQPVLFYGKDPMAGKTIKPIHYINTETPEAVAHPCPKPLGVMSWMVGRASLENEIVLDPFMGSGTTGIAALKANRKFIGIEIEPKYFDIATERITNAQRQQKLFEAA